MCCEDKKQAISRTNLLNKDLYENSLFALYVNPNQFMEKLKKVGLTIDKDAHEKDIKMLVQLNENGLDVKGSLKNSKKQPIHFNFKDLVKSITFNQQDIKNANIKFI